MKASKPALLKPATVSGQAKKYHESKKDLIKVKADIFISHAWGYYFHEFVSALENFASKRTSATDVLEAIDNKRLSKITEMKGFLFTKN